MKNGLFLQKETVLHTELDLIDELDNSSYLRRKQANYL